MSEGYSFGSAGKVLDQVVSRLVSDFTAAPRPTGSQWTTAASAYRTAREGTVRLVKDLIQTQIDFHPAPRSWSIAQVVDHLLLTEKLYRDLIKRMIAMARSGDSTTLELTIRDLDPSFSFLPTAVLPVLATPLTLINKLMPNAVRETMFRYALIPAISPGATEPAATRPAAHLQADLESSIDATTALFHDAMPDRLGAVVMTHPMIGSNNVLQILALITAHEVRHHGQIRAVQATPGYPRHVVF